MNSPIDTVSEITLTIKDVQELETELAIEILSNVVDRPY